jgi:glutamyl-tRNA synthetase
LKELEEVFDISGISKAPAIFDINKLTWMNGEYIRKMPVEEFHKLALPYYEKALTNKNIDTMKISKLLQIRTEVLTSIPETIDFIEQLTDYDIQMYVHKKSKTTLENSLESLNSAYPVLEAIKDWNETAIHEALFAHIEALGIKNSLMLWPVRTAISGKAVTPGGAIEIADILGKEETLRRIKVGMVKLENSIGTEV